MSGLMRKIVGRKPFVVMLGDEAVESFREAYRKDFGEDIATGEARVMAQNLLTLLEQLAKLPPGKSSTNQ